MPKSKALSSLRNVTLTWSYSEEHIPYAVNEHIAWKLSTSYDILHLLAKEEELNSHVFSSY